MPTISIARRKLPDIEKGKHDGAKWAQHFATYLELHQLTTWWDSLLDRRSIDETDLLVAVLGSNIDADPGTRQWQRLLNGCRRDLFGSRDASQSYLRSFVETAVEVWRPISHQFRGAI